MTEQQYKKYEEIVEELKPLKIFLFWCRKNKDSRGYMFDLIHKAKNLVLHRNTYFSRESENRFEISRELQERIVKVIDEYVQEKERELEAL